MNRVRTQLEQIQNHSSLILEILNRMNELHFYNMISIESKAVAEGRLDLEDLHFLTLEYSPEEILRLICLYSQIFPNPNFYSRFEREILEVIGNNYPPKYICYLHTLQKAGLLRNSKIKNKWEQLVLHYDLLPREPHSYTGVHITYSALSVRIL